MSLETARAYAWSLALTLMSTIVLVRAEDGYAARPAADYDGEEDAILGAYDPFAEG